MNKRDLKSYLNKSNREILKESCFNYDNKFIISDTYSVIILNDNPDLELKEDSFGFSRMIDNWKTNYQIVYTFMTLEENEDNYSPIDENYGINHKLFKRINNVIKGTTYTVLENKQDYTPYIIRLENTKTKEVGYMLPMRNF